MPWHVATLLPPWNQGILVKDDEEERGKFLFLFQSEVKVRKLGTINNTMSVNYGFFVYSILRKYVKIVSLNTYNLVENLKFFC